MTKMGYPQVLFNPNRVMGKNTIGNLLPNLAKAAGIKEWRKKTPHTLRQYFITTLANNPSVNAAETARLARHEDLSSQNAYIRTNDKSHAAAFNALSTVPTQVQGANPTYVPPVPNQFGLSLGAIDPRQYNPVLQQIPVGLQAPFIGGGHGFLRASAPNPLGGGVGGAFQPFVPPSTATNSTIMGGNQVGTVPGQLPPNILALAAQLGLYKNLSGGNGSGGPCAP